MKLTWNDHEVIFLPGWEKSGKLAWTWISTLSMMLYVLRVILLMNNIPSYSTNPKSFDSYRLSSQKKVSSKMDLPPRKLTWLAGKSTMKEDVFPIENRDFPACHVIVFRVLLHPQVLLQWILWKPYSLPLQWGFRRSAERSWSHHLVGEGTRVKRLEDDSN